MRRAALLLACILCVAGCGNGPVALRADRMLEGHVEPSPSGDVPTQLRAVSSRRAFLRFPRGRVLETRDSGRSWRTGRWPPPRSRIRPPGVTLPRCAETRSVAFADAEHGLVICGGVPGAGQQWKEFWSY